MRWLRYLLIVLVLASAGCQFIPLRMPIPSSLQSAPPLQVERAGLLWLAGRMKVGHWTLRDISISGWTNRCSHHLVSVDIIGTQSYSFTVSQKNSLRVACEIKRSARYLRFNDEPEAGHYSKLKCKFNGASEGNLLIEEALPAGTKAGNATFGAFEWDVRSVHSDARGVIVANHPLGYEIWGSTSAVAAIDTADDGRVWIDSALSEEDQQYVIGIAGALLLFDPPAGPDWYGWQDCR